MKLDFASLLLVLSVANHRVSAQSCLLDGCLQSNQKSAGSTTVYPYAKALATSYKNICPRYSLSVEEGGSSVGAKRVCGDATLGAVDIGNMSRDWKTSEATKQSDGYTFKCLIGDTSRSVAQIAIANDAVVMVVKPDPPSKPVKPVAAPKPAPSKPKPAKPSKPSPAAPKPSPVTGLPTAGCIKKLGCLSKDMLRWMYSNYTVAQLSSSGWTNVLTNSDNNDATRLWSELDSACQATEIKIAGTDPLSGEYDFFKSAILTGGTSEGFRSGFVTYVDKTSVNSYVVSNPGGIGFNNYVTGFSTSTVTIAPLKNSAGACVAPNASTVENLTYLLGRQNYVNVLKNNCTGLQASLGFLSYAVSSAGQTVVGQNNGIALTNGQVSVAKSRISTLAKCI